MREREKRKAREAGLKEGVVEGSGVLEGPQEKKQKVGGSRPGSREGGDASAKMMTAGSQARS